MSEFQFGGEFVWWPSPELIAKSNLQQFIEKHRLGSYDELMRRSTTDIAWFWDTVLRDLDIQFYKPYSRIVDLSDGKPWAKWCVDGEMNIVHNMLDKYAGTPTDRKPAIKSETEDGTARTLTYRELREQVDRMANSLRTLGLGKGDAIGVFMPMVPEIVVAMLAIIKIGGIFLPLFSGFGAAAIVSRLNDAEAKALFTAAGTYRRGKFCPMKPIADEAAAQIPTLRHLIVLNQAGEWLIEDLRRDAGPPGTLPGPFDDSPTERTSAEDPLMIIYTSGTTGKPKGAVHTHCGFPIKSAQDMWHGLDLHADETLFWMTDMGWMMGPWEVFGTLLLGATMMLYDGAPDFPGPDRVWSLVERHKVTTLGVSPTLIRALRSRFGDDEIVHNTIFRHCGNSLRRANRGIPIRGCGFSKCRARQTSHHQLFRRHGNLRRNRDGQRADADQTLRVFGPAARNGGGCRRRKRKVRARPGRRTGHSPAVDRNDARLLARSANATSKLTGRVSRTCGCTAIGPRSIKTDFGTFSAAPTTRSKSPANASVRPKSNQFSSRTRPSAKRPRSACRMKSKAKRWFAFAS